MLFILELLLMFLVIFLVYVAAMFIYDTWFSQPKHIKTNGTILAAHDRRYEGMELHCNRYDAEVQTPDLERAGSIRLPATPPAAHHGHATMIYRTRSGRDSLPPPYEYSRS